MELTRRQVLAAAAATPVSLMLNNVARAAGGSVAGLPAEPAVFFHPTLAGRAAPGPVQPVDGSIQLEEEPATWVQLSGVGPWVATRGCDRWRSRG